MRDKVTQVREYILDRISTKEFHCGANLPAARNLCQPTGASFAIVQRALNTLEDDGVLHCILRNGTRVSENYQNALVRNSVVCFRSTHPFLRRMRKAMEQKLPKLHMLNGFARGIFEIRTTMHVQQHMGDYLDLSEFLRGIDLSAFFSKPMEAFRQPDGRIFGIPFIFSPRVIFFNPALLAASGLKAPERDWTWEEFLALIRSLRAKLPPESVFNYIEQPYLWMNFVFRCGGALLSSSPEPQVLIDSPDTLRALQFMRDLRREMKLSAPLDEAQLLRNFAAGNSALLLGPREDVTTFREYGLSEWGVVPLPAMPGGVKATAMAADLICIRKECTDFELAGKYIRFLLSEATQNVMAEERYGIPILRSAAFRSLDPEDPRDLLFLNEMNTMSVEYNLDSEALNRLVCNGVNRIINTDDDLEEAARRLADAVRTFLAIERP